jgi:ABC-type branched-subunit amino acid transport system ATPase component
VPAHRIVGLGIAHVPEGRGIFGNLSVEENLRLATWQRRFGIGRKPGTVRAETAADLERVFGVFPRLKERLRQPGGTLSGGEQQMLAVGRALMCRPQLLLLDEPSMGLAPLLVREIFRPRRDQRRSARRCCPWSRTRTWSCALRHHAHVLEVGAIVRSGTGAGTARDAVRAATWEGDGQGLLTSPAAAGTIWPPQYSGITATRWKAWPCPNKVIFSMVRVSKFYDKRPVLKDISLGFYYGAKIGVLGSTARARARCCGSSPAWTQGDQRRDRLSPDQLRVPRAGAEALTPRKTVRQCVEEGSP